MNKLQYKHETKHKDPFNYCITVVTFKSIELMFGHDLKYDLI